MKERYLVLSTKKYGGGIGCGCFTILFFLLLIGFAIWFLPSVSEDGLTSENFKESITEIYNADSLEEGFHNILDSFSGNSSSKGTEGDLYYYVQLDEEYKKVYETISNGICKMDKSINLHSVDIDKLSSIYVSVLNDHPEYFWCQDSFRYQQTTTLLGESGYVTIFPLYNCSENEKESKQKKIDAVVEDCLAGISCQTSEYEKVKYVFEYIIHHTEYDKSATDNQNVYSVLVNKTSVCAGYAKTTQYLLMNLGVRCIYVTGYADGEEHAWNIVECEGKYYHVDTTWGDPICENSNCVQDHIDYNYLCCSDEKIFQTHVLNNKEMFPKCY